MFTIAYINYWEDPTNDNYFTKFVSHNIGEVKLVTPQDNPDILISSVFGDINNVNKYRSRCKIFYYGENLNKFPQYNEILLQNTFDLIIGFRYTNLEKKILRFPLWLMYYDFYSISNIETNIINYIEDKYKENSKKNKSMFASIVARYDNEGQRSKIWDMLSKYENTKGKIMSPSYFRNNTTNIGLSCIDKINYISNGIYNICPENSAFEGYFTEKIFQAFEGGTIPIYWAIDLPEKGLINENKYCFCNINNQKEMVNSIEKAMMNPQSYLEGNVFTENAADIIQGYYNDLRDNIKIKLGMQLVS